MGLRGMWWAGVLGLAVGAGVAPAAAQSPAKVGIVDVQQVLNLSKKGQTARSKLQADAVAKQKEIDAREDELKKLQAELEKQGAVLSDAAKREKEESLRRKLRDYRRMAEDANRDLAKREGELIGELRKEIDGIVRDLGRERGFTLIFEKQLVVYGSESADLTKEVIDRYDAKQR